MVGEIFAFLRFKQNTKYSINYNIAHYIFNWNASVGGHKHLTV